MTRRPGIRNLRRATMRIDPTLDASAPLPTQARVTHRWHAHVF